MSQRAQQPAMPDEAGQPCRGGAPRSPMLFFFRSKTGGSLVLIKVQPPRGLTPVYVAFVTLSVNENSRGRVELSRVQGLTEVRSGVLAFFTP